MPNNQHVSCGWVGCEQVNFGPIPSASVFVTTHTERVDFELRIRQHDKVEGHIERKLIWKDAPS